MKLQGVEALGQLAGDEANWSGSGMRKSRTPRWLRSGTRKGDREQQR